MFTIPRLIMINTALKLCDVIAPLYIYFLSRDGESGQFSNSF